MGQRRPFRRPGRAGGELDIDGIVRGQALGDLVEARPLRLPAQCLDL